MLRRERVEREIRRFDAEAFLHALPLWREAYLYFSTHPNLLRESNPAQPRFGEIEAATPQQLHSPDAVLATENALLAFGICAALSQQSPALASLATRLGHISADDARRAVVAIMATGETPGDRLHCCRNLQGRASVGFGPQRIIRRGRSLRSSGGAIEFQESVGAAASRVGAGAMELRPS
jgi:hypothetical protein